MIKKSKRRVNAETLRFNILTELPKYGSFKSLDNLTKDDIIQFIISAIDKCTEDHGDLYS
jgi:hypothetical protein